MDDYMELQWLSKDRPWVFKEPSRRQILQCILRLINALLINSLLYKG